MESPVIVDKPPEYYGNTAGNNDRGFPFDEEEGSGAWSELAARHPDIAARLRQRPATWARKRRPSSQDATDDFGDDFGFNRFPFDDIAPEFRDHFPSRWNRRFGSREEPQAQAQAQAQTSPQPNLHTAATQTEQDPDPGFSQEQQTHLPQYGLRNTVDLGQKSPADPSLVNADDRSQRSMSAPPDSRTNIQNGAKMSGQNHQDQHHAQPEQHSNVRHIPIFVEGRDEPVINKNVDHATHFGETKPTYVPPPQPHVEREQYFADDGPGSFHAPPNFSRAFGTPFNKGFRQGPQPFVQQKVYPQTAFARGASPQRSQSPKPQPQPDEHFVRVPVHHEHAAPKAETPSRSQHKQPSQQQSSQQHQPPPQQPPPQQQAAPQQAPPQPKPQPASANDPISQILNIQTDVLNLMSEVENFTGSKKDKKYMFLDEMLTRNLIKLDNIETDGKENIRQARKEAIKCIQKCIAVLEAKADKGGSTPQPQDVEMNENKADTEQPEPEEKIIENGEVEMTESAKDENTVEPEPQQIQEDVKEETAKKLESQPPECKKEEEKPKEQPPVVEQPTEKKELAQPQAADTRPESEKAIDQTSEIKEKVEDIPANPKKGTKTVKKRDKSKDKKDNKEVGEEKKLDKMHVDESKQETHVDDKGDSKVDTQAMEIDGAASQ